MEEITCIVPSYIEHVIQNLQKRNWLTHSFPLENMDMTYDIASYIYNKDVENITYTIVLDVNLYQFILNSKKKEKSNDVQRDAIALVVFCQVASIELDPTWAVYEKINYSDQNINEILDDLVLFNNINNSNNEILARFSHGLNDTYEIYDKYTLDRKSLEVDLLKYKRLTEWDSIYLIVLAIVKIKNDPCIRNNRLSSFLSWVVENYRKSLVTVIYATFLFSKKPLRKMMKYKPNDTIDNKKLQLSNMTWDLYLMRQYFKMWTTDKKDHEFIFASDDKAFNKMLRVGIEIQLSQNFKKTRGQKKHGVKKKHGVRSFFLH